METLQIQKADAVKAYNAATPEVRELLKHLFGKQLSIKITDRVKTFEDACEVTGDDPGDVRFQTGTADEIAYKKLKVIVKALNEGVVLDFGNPNQRKWYPWFEYVGSGFRFDDTDYDHSFTSSAGGSRLCFHTDELAKYAGTQFIDLYNQFLK